MRCPFCFEKIDKYSNVCNVCGFRKTELDSASNKLVNKYRKKDPECVINVTTIPSDVNRTTLFFLCLFGGFFGLHSFYVRKYFKGFASMISAIILIVGTPFVFGDIIVVRALVGSPFLTSFVGVFGAIATLMWFSDFFGLIFGKFKIPVVLKDRI